MAKDKSPAFQWYPKDFETDEIAACMTLAERGVYITLLGYCWLEGSIPNDERRLARLCRCTESEFKKTWQTVSRKFVSANEDRLVNPRLEEERLSQREHSERRKSAGKAGNVKRWGIGQSDRNATPPESQSDKNLIAFDRSSSSSAKEETKNVSSSCDSVIAELIRRHPKKSAPSYAQTEFLTILSESPDPDAIALSINGQHAKWCKYWRDIGTQAQFVPKLMDWLKGGDWQLDPPAANSSEPEYPKPLM